MSGLKIHLKDGFDKTLAPIRAEKIKDWWDDNTKTKDHAKHCLPLTMANSLGWYILSPGTFIVRWNGDTHSDAQVEAIEKSSHYEVDNHAAFGSFTIQANFIPVTSREGDFVYIKGMPNERMRPYTCMEACIEAWWSMGNFGLVFLLNQPGEFLIPIGTPIAQMFVYRGGVGAIEADIVDGYPPGHAEWLARRSRPGYKKDLDYMKGQTAGGAKIHTHITNWKSAEGYQ